MAIKIVASSSEPDEGILPQEDAKHKENSFSFLFKHIRMDKLPYLCHTSSYQKNINAILFLTWFQFKWYIQDHVPIKWPPCVAKTKMDLLKKKALCFIASHMVSSLTYRKVFRLSRRPRIEDCFSRTYQNSVNTGYRTRLGLFTLFTWIFHAFQRCLWVKGFGVGYRVT